MELITTLITAITAVSALAPAAFRWVAEHRWLVGFRLLGLSLLHGLHAHAPWLFWVMGLFLFLLISLMLLWAASAP
jgi:hypothetical protein